MSIAMAKAEPVPYLNGEAPVLTSGPPDGPAPIVEEYTGPALNRVQNVDVDVIVVGAGLSGITALDRFRKAGYSVKIFESGTDFGGVWYWNTYPGARVDSEAPFYQLNIPEVWRDWSFAERYPSQPELKRYMAHVDNVLNLRRDTYFNARVNDCTWNAHANNWTIKTEQGHVGTAKYLILCTGLLHRKFTPDFPGLSDYKGTLCHSGAWDQNFSAKGKKIGLIGAGATAVQITQELGKVADELTVLLRRPSHCLAMRQRQLTKEEGHQLKTFLPTLFKGGRNSQVGFPHDRGHHGVLDIPEDKRDAEFAYNWEKGGFNFVNTFNDIAVKPEANQIIYTYWRKRVCERLTDPEKQKIMCPEKPQYYFFTKRTPLEHDYYEVLNQSNVKLHDLSASPIKKFTEKGIETADGQEHEFDAVVLATGFDSFTGSLTHMGLKNKDGVDLKDVWSKGVSTYLGLMIQGFPNMFMAYSPQSPTAFSNGATIIEAQVESVVELIKKIDAEGSLSVDTTDAAQEEWRETCDATSRPFLFQYTDSWWNASNVPGKKKENLIYMWGIDNYERICREKIEKLDGFEVVRK